MTCRECNLGPVCMDHSNEEEISELLSEITEFWTKFEDEESFGEAPEVKRVISAGLFKLDRPIGITLTLEDGSYAIASFAQLEKALFRYNVQMGKIGRERR